MQDLLAAGTDSDPGAEERLLNFEIFVQPGFSHLELSSVLAVLQAVNDVRKKDQFSWQITSDRPGMLASNGDMLVRAEPAIGDQYLRHAMFIIGGQNCRSAGWLPRLRAMQRAKRPVMLFSDAATEYIKSVSPARGPVTTHWRDIDILSETGDYPTMSKRLAENNDGVFTSAGQGYAMEAVISFLGGVLGPQDSAGIASMLILEDIRGFQRDQPKGISDNPNFFEKRLQKAIAMMEETIENPLKVSDLADQVGVSTRQLERLFMVYLNTSPARFYKQIRLKRANTLISDTRMPLIDVAIVCGFSNTSSLSQAYRQEYGKTPNQARKA